METPSQAAMPKITAYESAELTNSLHKAGIPLSAIAQTYHDPSMQADAYYLSITPDRYQGYRQTHSFKKENQVSTWADAIVAGYITTHREKRP